MGGQKRRLRARTREVAAPVPVREDESTRPIADSIEASLAFEAMRRESERREDDEEAAAPPPVEKPRDGSVHRRPTRPVKIRQS
jgi:hypothetical protein